MPTFGEFETYGEPLAVTEERGHVSTVWQARKSGGDNRLFVVKCYAPRPRSEVPGHVEPPLEKDRSLEFLEGVKQIKKAQSEGGRNLAPVHDLGKSAVEAWYVTDHYPRNHLKAWIARRGGVDSGALRHVVQSVVAGCLALKRSRGYSHGNLKPSNIFLVGQPRPLKRTPLVLTDAYPAAPAQLAALDAGERAQVGELLAQVVEAQDLRNIGELILQLVEGRLLTRSDDYNYPVQRSSIWNILSKDADDWLKLCNQLVNPQLSLETINLESLAAQFRPPVSGAKIAIGLAAIAAVCLIGGGVYYGIVKIKAAAERKRVERQQQYEDAIREARDAFARQDYSNTLVRAATVLVIRPGDPEATKLKTDAQAQLDEQSYQTALNDGKAAFEQQDYPNALTKAQLALSLKPGDTAATKLKDDSQLQLNTRMTQDQLRAAQAAAEAAEAAGDWPAAAREWQKVQQLGGAESTVTPALAFAAAVISARANLASAESNAAAGPVEAQMATNLCSQVMAALPRPDLWAGSRVRVAAVDALTNQVVAVWRKADDLIRSAALTATQMEQKYEAATNSAGAALARKDYGEATNQAAIALLIRPNDSVASRIKMDAQQAAESAAMTARQQARKFQDATNAAVAAFGQGQYEEATNQAGIALSIQPDDPVARKVMSDAQSAIAAKSMTARQQEQNYRDATNAAGLALVQRRFEDATNKAAVALVIKPGDPVAQSLLLAAQRAIEAAAALALQQEQKFRAATNAAGEAFATGNYREVTNQTGIALAIRTNDSTALDLYAKAQDKIQQALLADLQRERNYEAATNAAGAALAAHRYSDATNQAALALSIRTNDVVARQIMSAAQSAMEAAALAARQQEQQFEAATNAAGVALAKGNYEEANNQARIALSIRTNDAVAIYIKGQADQGLDLQSARDSFKQGEYEKALQVCGKYGNAGPFAALVQSIQAEQKVLTEDNGRFSDGDYSFIDALKQQSYSAKNPFARLLTSAVNENQILTELQKLKAETNWSAVKTRLADLSALAGKPPFKELGQWADGQAAEQERLKTQRVAELDTRFEVLLVTLNVSKPRWLQMPGARNAKVYPSDTMSEDQKKYYLKQVNDLENEYKGWNLLQDRDRGSYFPKLRKSIVQW